MREPIIIALSGKKGAGKNTIALFIQDYFIRSYHGDRSSAPVVFETAFADLVKEFCIDVLGLEKKQCYGSDEEKNTPTKYLWENTPAFELYPLSDTKGEPMGPMTGRDVMQIFGTECVRHWFGNAWIDATIRKIMKINPALAIITDNRFPNEVDSILNYPNGNVIRLTRSPYGDDSHKSEIILDNYDWNKPNCFVVDNANMSMTEQNDAVKLILDDIFNSRS